MLFLVSGSRDFADKALVQVFLSRRLKKGDVLFVGDARGVDAWAITTAHALGVQAQIFKADWKFHGKCAGPIRNRDMWKNFKTHTQPEKEVIIFWDGYSAGTEYMIDCVREDENVFRFSYYIIEHGGGTND